MAAWRSLASTALLLVVAPLATAQTYPLAEALAAGDCFKVRLEMSLAGELKVKRDGKTVPLKLAATATHEFPERVLTVGKTGLAEKVARVYQTAQATITAGDERSQRTLRPERRLVVAQRHDEQSLAYSPAGGLTREELELTGEHFDTLSLVGLLPGKAVAVGETWKVSNAAAQALCGFDGLTEQGLTCKLEEVKDNVARVTVTGTASGIELGAQVKLTVDGAYRFDLGCKRLVGLDWRQKDDRDQGPASPASSVRTTTEVTRTPIEQPPSLSDVALVSVPEGFEVPPPLVNLDYRDPKGRFVLAHGREWQVVSQTDEHVVMRLMEQGEFVAQVTITPWTADPNGKHMTADEFKEAMARTPGWEPERELQTGEVPGAGDGHWVYRVSALGKMDGLDVMQNFYLVAGPKGQQVVLLFTMTPKKAMKLGDRDLSMAGSIDFPAAKP
ncbi:MAG TPA: hypothetical protein VJ739_05635 [Gemmataceae bacterium]|nr:hypothetical protein [Gemmataceae bacterium]